MNVVVSFCAIRIELEDQAPPIEVDFSCGHTIEDLLKGIRLTNPVAASAAVQNPQGPKARGRRQTSEISVATYKWPFLPETSFPMADRARPSGPRADSGARTPNSSNSKESSPSEVSSSSFKADEQISSSCDLSQRSTKDSTPSSVVGEPSQHSSEPKDSLNFVSGNPFVEVTKGILHLYKENSTTSLEDGVIRSHMLCMLGVPAKHKMPDLLQFTAPVHANLEMMRVIHDGSPNQYMVLLRFRCQDSADEFYQAYNGLPYNSMEPEVCSLVYVSKVETCKESEYYPLADHTELPVCTICLERMDESVSTVLTILCNHSFHGQCLAKWDDTTCPVCRYNQSPEVVAEQRCSECMSSEDLWICLICGYIGCGRYVGGHSHKHFVDTAHSYTMELGQNRVWDYVGDNFVHRLMQTDSADGKLVEAEGRRQCPECHCKVIAVEDLPQPPVRGGTSCNELGCCNRGIDKLGDTSCEGGGGHGEGGRHGHHQGGGGGGGGHHHHHYHLEADEKIDSIQLEYSYLLTSQLESQRRYFEEKMSGLEADFRRRMEEVEDRTNASVEESTRTKSQLDKLAKEKVKSERKVGDLSGKLARLTVDLQEERQMNKSLMENQKIYQGRVQEYEAAIEEVKRSKDAKIVDLEEQLRDLMFFIGANQTISASPLRQEIQGGDIIVGGASGGQQQQQQQTGSRTGGTSAPGGAKSKKKHR